MFDRERYSYIYQIWVADEPFVKKLNGIVRYDT